MSTLPQQRLRVPSEVDEQDFYTNSDGERTLVSHSDLEYAVKNTEKPYLRELERYWVNKPYAFVVIYRNVRDNETQYVVVEPRMTSVEDDLFEFFKNKLRTSMSYSRISLDSRPSERARVIRDETLGLMKRYNLLGADTDIEATTIIEKIKSKLVDLIEAGTDGSTNALEEEQERLDSDAIENLSSTQVRRILYYLVRDFIRFGKIDPLKHDVNIEDISCDGYNIPVFVYHSSYGEQVVTNISYDEKTLDNFVKTLAQNAGKGISRRQPNVDATLSDGSRAQLTLGTEISDYGSNFTIRQFNDIPFTPIDLISWKTFSIDQIVYLWLAIEHEKSLIFAGGTASGKTTSLNAMSLFMPSSTKIVSIEDTRELEIPQTNWIANMTRESFHDDGAGEITEFDLLEDALRKRPDYVMMGEVRGEEGQTLFQLLNTGHTTYTTFHADSATEVIRRFTTEPINVAPSMFDALDLISIQRSVELGGSRVRRNINMVEVEEYQATEKEFSVNNMFTWERNTDSFYEHGDSNILEEIKSENGWSDADLEDEWNRRKLVLAHMLEEGINTYAGVAATIQGYMTSPETILSLVSDNKLISRISGLHQMKNITIDVDPEKEALTPRPSVPDDVLEEAERIKSDHRGLLAGFSSDKVDFAKTVEDLLSEGQISADDEELIKELSDENQRQELPGSTSGSDMTDGVTQAGTSFGGNDELSELFADEDETEQTVLTSDALREFNESQGFSEEDIDEDKKNVAEVDETNVDDEISELFGGEGDEDEDQVDADSFSPLEDSTASEDDLDTGKSTIELEEDNDDQESENSSQDKGEENTDDEVSVVGEQNEETETAHEDHNEVKNENEDDESEEQQVTENGSEGEENEDEDDHVENDPSDSDDENDEADAGEFEFDKRPNHPNIAPKNPPQLTGDTTDEEGDDGEEDEDDEENKDSDETTDGDKKDGGEK